MTFLIYTAAAMLLGVLTSISPCPMATNIAAISYVGRRVGDARSVVAAGLLYTLGRSVTYAALAAAISAFALSIPAVSRWLQGVMPLVLAPLFLLLGMFLTGLVTMEFAGTGISQRLQQRIDALGPWGAFVLGALLAVSFCPTSAWLFFGLLTLVFGAEVGTIAAELSRFGVVLPQEAPAGSLVTMPMVYGLGTALPVLLVAFVMAYSAASIGRTYNVLSKFEWWARQITGWIFVALGTLFASRNVFELGV